MICAINKKKKVCMFELWLYILVNSYGHFWDVASVLWDFFPTLGCHDTQNVLENIPFVESPWKQWTKSMESMDKVRLEYWNENSGQLEFVFYVKTDVSPLSKCMSKICKQEL